MSECTNELHIPVAEMNEAALPSIEEHALTAEAVEQVVRLSESDDVRDGQKTLQLESKDIAKHIARLLAAIETGGGAVSLVAKLREL